MEMSFAVPQTDVCVDEEIGRTLTRSGMSKTETQDKALICLLHLLQERQFSFVTPTPATHARIIARADRQRGMSLRDVLGWSLPFEAGAIDPKVENLLQNAGMVEASGRCSARKFGFRA